MRAVLTRPVYVVESVGDGDTLTAVLDMGADTFRRCRLRLVVVDTPERGQPGWTEARDFTAAWCQAHAPTLTVNLQLTRTGRLWETFGRLMADVYDLRTGATLSSALLESGHAVLWTD